MESNEELILYLNTLLEPGYWNSLTERGEAWSTMRINGELPESIRSMGATIDGDLEEYGFAVLRAALALREKSEGEPPVLRQAFEKAGQAFEFLITNAASEFTEYHFLSVVASASYHLGGYSAIAYSILNKVRDKGEQNFSPAEIALSFLILRDLFNLRNYVKEFINEETSEDSFIAASMNNGETDLDSVVATILNISICKGLAYFDFALETGNEDLFQESRKILKAAVKLAADYGNVPIWWISRLCLNLITDLWQHSLHQVIPVIPPEGVGSEYSSVRELFIATLYGRNIAEIELWPSQLEAARRSTSLSDDLVVALPTSAGKTRIAEMACMVTLSTGKRVIIVTPLRALSAQTERSFRKTFTPLGYSVSSLYGASGTSNFDEDSLRSRDIVIATPEKLDFALRSDASILNDIGLIILDEGHMIGNGEREIRYEILVQGLLKRSDADSRRIVCLSAILPDGDNLNDFTSWMRLDSPGSPVKAKWRPTRQRFGKLTLKGNNVVLNFNHQQEVPFINPFFVKSGLNVKGTSLKPADLKELTLFSAWKFAEQNKKTLIFVTQANWVEGFGKKAVELVRRGYLPSLIQDTTPIEKAVQIGKEWLGADHPAVKALEIGIGIHHGNLPSPFLRELEVLLSQGIIRVTAASPTLSQGLNINAAVLLMPYLVRSGQTISGVEFANVVGRAGRAFVDVEGLVLHVIYDNAVKRGRDWSRLVNKSRERTLTSGLFLVLNEAYDALSRTGILKRKNAYEFLANHQEAWITSIEKEGVVHDEYVMDKLDNIVLGLVEALDTDAENLPYLLDEALSGSLWLRQVERQSDELKAIHKEILKARAKLIWKNSTPAARRGYFAMGIGLDNGKAIDMIAADLEDKLEDADWAAVLGDLDSLITNLTELAQALFKIHTFSPDKLPDNWKLLLRQWVSGKDITEIGAAEMPFIENAFCYKLVWALEAIRVRRLANGWVPDYRTGGASAAVENGLPLLAMSMLVRAGLPSRRAAMIAVLDTPADFNNTEEMRAWLKSDLVEKLSLKVDWPTVETAQVWRAFKQELSTERVAVWEKEIIKDEKLITNDKNSIREGQYRIEIGKDESTWLLTPDFKKVAKFERDIFKGKKGLINAVIEKTGRQLILTRFGPKY